MNLFYSQFNQFIYKYWEGRFSLQKNVGRRLVDPRGAAVCGLSKDLGDPHLCQLLLEVGQGACLLMMERSNGWHLKMLRLDLPYLPCTGCGFPLCAACQPPPPDPCHCPLPPPPSSSPSSQPANSLSEEPSTPTAETSPSKGGSTTSFSSKD